MVNLYRRKLEKIFTKVDKLAIKGRDNKIEYTQYIDELINKGDYSAFQEMLIIFYDINTLDFRDVAEVKLKTWDEICFQTKSSFLTKLSKLYKRKRVYQQSHNIYTEDNSRIQISISDKLTHTFSHTGITASIDFMTNGDIVQFEITDSNIYNVEIFSANWELDNLGNEIPQNVRPIEDFQISYFADSTTTFNPSDIVIGDHFTLSVTPQKQFEVNQIISVTHSGNFLEGIVQSYDRESGETVLEITNSFGGLTSSNWIVNYLSGPKNPVFNTKLSKYQSKSYLVSTYEKDKETQEFKKYNYNLIIQNNPILGQIYEKDIMTPNSKYLMQDKNFAQLVGERRIYLEVFKSGSTQSIIFDYENPTLSYDANLISRYDQALNYLLL